MTERDVGPTIDYDELVDRLYRRAIVSRRSKYRGVAWHKSQHRWRMTIKYRGKVYSRDFKREEDAARAYDVCSSILRGKKAPEPNFDGEPPKNTTREQIRHSMLKNGILSPKTDADLLFLSFAHT